MVLSCRHILPRYPPGDLSDGKSRIWVIFTVIIDNIGDSKVENKSDDSETIGGCLYGAETSPNRDGKHPRRPCTPR